MAQTCKLFSGFARDGNHRLTCTDALDASGFTAQVAEVIQFGATHTTHDRDFDLGDFGRVDGERTFDAATIGNLANGERFANATTATANDDTFENLDAFFVAFLNIDVHANGIAGTEIRQVGANLFLFNCCNNWASHDIYS